MKTIKVKTFPFGNNRAFINPEDWKIRIINSKEEYVDIRIIEISDLQQWKPRWLQVTHMFIDDPI